MNELSKIISFSSRSAMRRVSSSSSRWNFSGSFAAVAARVTFASVVAFSPRLVSLKPVMRESSSATSLLREHVLP